MSGGQMSGLGAGQPSRSLRRAFPVSCQLAQCFRNIHALHYRTGWSVRLQIHAPYELCLTQNFRLPETQENEGGWTVAGRNLQNAYTDCVTNL